MQTHMHAHVHAPLAHTPVGHIDKYAHATPHYACCTHVHARKGTNRYHTTHAHTMNIKVHTGCTHTGNILASITPIRYNYQLRRVPTSPYYFCTFLIIADSQPVFHGTPPITRLLENPSCDFQSFPLLTS